MDTSSATSTNAPAEPRHQKGKPWEELIGQRAEWHFIATATDLHAAPSLPAALKLARGLAFAENAVVQVSRARNLFGHLAGTSGEPVYVSIG
jgi:hypothetical protein